MSARFAEDDTPIYFTGHTDGVSLINNEGQVERLYFGIELNSKETIEDKETLLIET